ncbi:Heterogeneous nuclear ribonucleoprotein A/B [Zootermopsis nevadensis]|uniref:Heterogeneous nuclear ribonucleoprotein A/B n=1 Tax=Zootermopsis nevadensis TaxID=136037 RepID=A0A067R065_ZOONE|nr:Heterogeneous nuclear ribonucleoprotein A/B [Zootermopsis nevadensis]
MAARAINKLFVGNLPWTIGNRELKAYFSEFGHVVSATVVFDRNTGMSRGYGFVLFSTQGGYDSVTNRHNHILEGNILSVQPAGN